MSLGKIVVCLTMMAALANAATAQINAPPAPAGSSRLDDAKILITNGKYLKAIPLLESIVSSDKASAPQALGLMADCCKARRNWSKALDCFQTLLSDYPNAAAPDREVKLSIMDCYLANKEPEKALALQKELLGQFGPDAWRVHHVMGRRYIWIFNPTKAIVELEKAMALGAASKNAVEMIDVNRRLLHCYVAKKQREKVEELAQRLNKDYPSKSHEWNYELGRFYLGQEEYTKAIESLEAAAKTAPKTGIVSNNIHKALLDCYDEIDRLDKAIPLAEELVAGDPGKSSWQWRLGWYYLTKQQYDKAAPLFEQVIKSSKAAWEIRKALIFRGQCLYALGKGPDALEMVETYFKDKPAQWDDHLLIKAGVLFYGPRDDAGCVAALTELLAQVDVGKNSVLAPAARELMLRALTRKGDWAEVAVMAEKMGTASKDPRWLPQAGEAYYKAGDYTQAKRVYKAGMDGRDTPGDVRAKCMHGLALCYWETGLKDAARRLALRVMDEYSGTLAATSAINSLNMWAVSK